MTFRTLPYACALLLGLVSLAPAGAKTIAGPYSPAAGLQYFEAVTGHPAPHPSNGIGTGWCTWFVHAVAPYDLPRSGSARTYWSNFDGVKSRVPVPGSVVVWGGQVGRGYGHVGFVTAVDVEPGTFDVWDSNFSSNWDKRIRWRRHRSDDPKLLGFIYPHDLQWDDPEETLPVPDHFDLAFVRDGNLHVYSTGERQSRQLTEHGEVAHPTWSADGRHIVFEQAGNLSRLDLDTGKFHRLSTSGICYQPAAHPELPVLWFVRLIPNQAGDPKRADLWRIGLDGKDARRLGMVTRISPALTSPVPAPGRTVWKPDGTMAAVQVRNAPGSYYFDGDGKPLEIEEPLADLTAWRPVPAWQPNGSLLAMPENTIASPPSGKLSLLDETTDKIVSELGLPEGLIDWPVFSPHGDAIVYTAVTDAERYEGLRLFVHNLSGDRATILLDDAAEPAWAPSVG